MELIFENIGEIGQGNYPDFVQFEKTEGQLFFLQNGEMMGTPSEKFDGDFSSPIWRDTEDIGPDNNSITNLELKVLPGFGIVGSYKAEDTHKLIIYEFSFIMDQYLDSGSIGYSIDDPITKFNLNLKNPLTNDAEHPGNAALSELGNDNNLLAPGARIKINFGAGSEDPEYEMGTFFVDRSSFDLLESLINVDARNTIGKVLKDQTLDEKNEFWYQTIDTSIRKLFEDAGLERDKYLVETTDVSRWFNFAPNTTYFSALETMLEVLPQWKIVERADGVIVVGSPNYIGFDLPGIYTFQRNKDIFSRQIVREDDRAYNRVCVHTENFEKAVYRDVKSFKAWNLQTNKTLYVQIAEGLKYSDLTSYADELASRLEGVGKIESFRGPFRPHLQCGDEAIITNQNGIEESLGVITEIDHSFGIQGFYTDFTVDSGGTVGKGRISDYITKITGAGNLAGPNTGWDDIDDEDYINIAPLSEIVVSTTRKTSRPSSLLNDNLMYAPNDKGWSPATDDTNPYIDIVFNQRCMINALQIYVGYDDVDTDPIYLPDYYKVQYYDDGVWREFITIDSASTPMEIRMLHEFSAIETSKIRFTLHQKPNQLWREIQVWGYM
jgi:hypothetical protein